MLGVRWIFFPAVFKCWSSQLQNIFRIMWIDGLFRPITISTPPVQWNRQFYGLAAFNLRFAPHTWGGTSTFFLKVGNIRRRSCPDALCGPFIDAHLADSAYTEPIESRGRQPFCNGTPSPVLPRQTEHRWCCFLKSVQLQRTKIALITALLTLPSFGRHMSSFEKMDKVILIGEGTVLYLDKSFLGPQTFSFILGLPFGMDLRLPPGFIPESLPFRLVVIAIVFFDDWWKWKNVRSGRDNETPTLSHGTTHPPGNANLIESIDHRWRRYRRSHERKATVQQVYIDSIEIPVSLVHGDHVAVILSDVISDDSTVGAGGEWFGEPLPGSPGEGVPIGKVSVHTLSRHGHV